MAGATVPGSELRRARSIQTGWLALGILLGAVAAPATTTADILTALLAAAESATGPSAHSAAEPAGDAVAVAAPAPAGSLTAARTGELKAAPGFTLRRVPNPNYKPGRSQSSALPAGTMNRLKALDFARASFSRRGDGTPHPLTEWMLSVGEQYRDNRSIEVLGSFVNDTRGTFLRAARISGRDGPTRLMLGDVMPVVVPGVATLHRMRGAALLHEPRIGPSVSLMGGGPTPVPGFTGRSIGVGAALVDRVEIETSRVSFGAIGFGQGAAPASPFTSRTADSLAGGGGEAFVGVHTPVGAGVFGAVVGGGWHDLDGTPSLTARHALEWRMITPSLVVHLRDERASPRTRVVSMDLLREAPTREDRWNVRMRTLGGRGETHVTGVLRDGGDPALQTRTMTAGASGSWGASAWYSGLDFTWDYRTLTASGERRMSLHSGRASRGGHAFVMRLQRNSNDLGRAAIQASGEALLALPRGMRFSLEPRLSWNDDVFRDAHVETRITLPLRMLGARLRGGVAFGTSRDDGFQGKLRQAELAVSIVPRSRDRGDFEVRRLSDGPSPSYEYSAAYELEAARYESPAGSWLTRADSGRVVVRVVRSGNLTGVPNVLVKMDDTELRFTDEDGFVVFERVSPGIHVVGVEERSLPEMYEIVHASRAFVTVEEGRIPDPVLFEVARPARRKSF